MLPHIFKDTDFAMHGGTAINFFLRNMPRISVDIDLIYQKLLPRNDTLRNISSGLETISEKIIASVSGTEVRPKIYANNLTGKLFVIKGDALIKIEPNHVTRGNVFGTTERDISQRAEEIFEKFVTARTLALEDIYGSKICAALDRQHPRDLFDIKILLETEGLTEKIKKAFLVYLICNNRPISELLAPNLLDIKPLYEKEFAGMALDKVRLEDLMKARVELINIINSSISDTEKSFLVSFKQGAPDWSLLGVEGISELPAVKWKLINIGKMNPSKHKEATDKLKRILKY